jgi:hypothetical protein
MGVNQCNIALGEERGGGALGMLTDDLLCYTFEFLDFSDLSSVRQVRPRRSRRHLLSY